MYRPPAVGERIDCPASSQVRTGFKNNARRASGLELCRVAAKVGHKQQAAELKLTVSEAVHVYRQLFHSLTAPSQYAFEAACIATKRGVVKVPDQQSTVTLRP